MSTLVFKDVEGLKRVLEHTLKATSWMKDFDGKEQKGTFSLVHDDGVYVMSSNADRDVIDTRLEAAGKPFSFVVYAEGCSSKENKEDFWETSRELVGGDDFVEFLPLAWLQACVSVNKPLVLSVAKGTISFTEPKEVRRAPVRPMRKVGKDRRG